jgi:hypothetical protein
MAVKLKRNKLENNDSSRKTSNTIEFLFFIALNILVIPFSAYQTYIGYEKDVAGNAILAMVVAAISGVLFAAMNFGIRDSRLKGEKHHLKVLMYMVPIGLSFFGNFNAFYSNQMKDNLLRTEVNNYKYVLTQTRDIALQKIEEIININNFGKDYNQKFNDLNTEYYDATPPSWGPKAQGKWEILVQFLQSQGGVIKVTDQGNSKDYYFKNATVFANNAFETLKEDKLKVKEEPVNYINIKYNPVIKEIDSLKNQLKPVLTSSMLDKMVETENQIRSKAESFLNTENIFDYPALKPSTENEIGTIKHTINSAFVKRENMSATIFSLFLSIIIDLAALLYILVFIPYKTEKPKGGRLNRGPNRI